jgi:hypothetical protein
MIERKTFEIHFRDIGYLRSSISSMKFLVFYWDRYSDKQGCMMAFPSNSQKDFQLFHLRIGLEPIGTLLSGLLIWFVDMNIPILLQHFEAIDMSCKWYMFLWSW